MTILDRDITKGLLRERVILKRLIIKYIMNNSPMVRNYVKSISRVTGLPEDVVARSEPVKRYIERMVGID